MSKFSILKNRQRRKFSPSCRTQHSKETGNYGDDSANSIGGTRKVSGGFFAHDAEGLLALYDSEATMVPGPDEKPIVGHAAIQEALKDFLALKPRDGEMTTTLLIENGDVALMGSKWRFTCAGPDGNPVEMSGTGTEVMKRREDGSWVHLIDNPWSGEFLD